MEMVFQLSNLFVLPFWLLMVLAPHWRVTRRLMESALPVVVLAALYAALVVPRIGPLWGEISHPSLKAMARLLGSPVGTTIAWAHFLTFDLFVGRWIYFDSQKRHFSPWIIGPILFLTLMFGPLGYLVYALFRALTSDRTPVQRAALDWLRGAFNMALGWNQPLAFLTAASLLGFAAAVIGVLVDPRVITGAPAWLKPAKFLVSAAIYGGTLAWLLRHVHNRPRLVSRVAWFTTVGLAAELIIIGGQAACGTTSHFNTATPLDALLWDAMAFFIVVVWVAGLVTATALLRQSDEKTLFSASLRLALTVTLFGMAQGFLMPPLGRHTVGAPDGGPGLPIVGWSTAAGDLRVGHFFGLHALQVIPLLGWVLRQLALTTEQRLSLLRIGVSVYAGVVMLVTWQALRGQSLVRPDALTLSALGGLLVFALAAVLLTVPKLVLQVEFLRGTGKVTDPIATAEGVRCGDRSVTADDVPTAV